jgi:CBS domain-containing protein
MLAKDVMTTTVITVAADTPVREIAEKLLDRHVSALPVVDDEGGLLGIVSEGDLIRRPETGAERHPSWWLRLLASPQERALNYIKTHGGHAREVMTRNVVSVAEDASLEEVADALERHRIKRVPVLRDGKLVGIVSRADLLRGLVARQSGPTVSIDDDTIKSAVVGALSESGVRSDLLSLVVSGGVVNIWGAVNSIEEMRAAKVAAESVPGVKEVRDRLSVLPPIVRATMWAE